MHLEVIKKKNLKQNNASSKFYYLFTNIVEKYIISS